jgi:two-component system response regulator YesN
MKSVLIVEDEKMIRLGIKAMISRSTVPVEQIYDCKNGEEALEILNKEPIDVMITDIRMPKMDGIQLVKEARKLSHVPKMAILSGYDDFSYAVEVMRCGIKHYLLKPIEREKMNQLLEELEEELQEEYKQQYMGLQIEIQQLKYLLLNPNLSSQEMDIMEQQYGEHLKKDYVVGCTNRLDVQSEEFVDVLHDVNGQDIFIYYGNNLDEFCQNNLAGNYYGISKKHAGIHELNQAYKQAVAARRDAFVRVISCAIYSDAEIQYKTLPKDDIEKFVQLCGSNRFEDGVAMLDKDILQAKQGFVAPVDILDMIKEGLERIFSTYKNVTTLNQDDSIYRFFDILSYDSMETYYNELIPWLRRMNEKIQSEFDDYKNKEKINQAIRYIQENYAKDLNMAVVSNYISMNYSLFSLTFKQYTGVNFVNYLKEIRINEAKRLLRETDDRIIDISHAVGYDNEKHFMKTFKSLCGVSPSEYRKNNRVGAIGK